MAQPKSAANSATEVAQNDAMYLFNSLRHCTTPITINVAEVAAGLGPDTKVNTVSKRLTNMKKKYSINISCTTVGAAKSATAANGDKNTIEKKASKKGNGATTITAPSSPTEATTTTITTRQKVLNGRVTKGGSKRAAAGAKGGRGKKKTNGKNSDAEADNDAKYENITISAEARNEKSDNGDGGDLAAVATTSKPHIKAKPKDTDGDEAESEERNAPTYNNVTGDDSSTEEDKSNNDMI